MTKILKATSGRLFGRVTSGTGRAEELLPADVRTLLSVSTTAEIAAVYQPIGSYAAASHTHTASQVTDFSEATDDRVAALLTAGTNITITYNDAANTLTVASTAGGLSGTGSVDNAALRADGAGGATLQNSAWIIADNATTSPNNTVNHASLQATGGTTNVSVSIVPKGTGAFCLAVPDGTSAGGNARGNYSVDLQRTRSAASQVASGTNSIILGGENNTATGSRGAMVGGYGSTSSGSYESFAYGESCTASAANSLAFGYQVQSNSPGCVAFGYKTLGRLNYGLFLGAGQFAAQGDAQSLTVPMRNKTTSATPVALRLDNYGNLANRFTVPSGKLVTGILQVEGVKSDGSAIALYTRRIAIKNVGGTTTLIQNQTIGTDYEDNASTDLTVTADDTNDSLEISVTGIASETWRWNAVFDGIEIEYGT